MLNIAFISASIKGGGTERATVNLVNGFCHKEGINAFLFSGVIQENEYCLEPKVVRCCILRNKLFDDLNELRKCIKKNNIYSNICVCLLKRKNVHTKFVISERNAPKHDFLSWKSKLLRFLLYRRADGYVFQTNEAKQFYSKKIQQKGIVIHNSIKVDIPLKSDANKKEIVAIGRLMPQKNYEMLLKAFAIVHKRYPEYILRIFGEGEKLVELQEIAFELCIENNVVFEGYCTDVHRKIVDSEIYVLSSDFEGMPNALMEAMAMGFPVVSTNCYGGGAAELIENGINGLLSPVNNEIAFADNIIGIIDNANLKKNISEAAKAIVVNHTDEKIVEQWMSYFLSLF